MRLTASCWLGSLEVFFGVTNRWLGLGGCLGWGPSHPVYPVGGWVEIHGRRCVHSFFLGFSVLKKLVEPTPVKKWWWSHLDDYRFFLKKWWIINQQIKKIVVSFGSLCQKFSFLRRTQIADQKSASSILEHCQKPLVSGFLLGDEITMI